MEQILKNMALHLLTRFCLDHSIDCSNTYCVKNGRGFTYSLRDGDTGTREIAQITFHKSQVPTYRFGQEAK